MKKFVALLLAMLLVLANVAALADPTTEGSGTGTGTGTDTGTGTGTDAPEFHFQKAYTTNVAEQFPKETLKFTVSPDNKGVSVPDFNLENATPVLSNDKKTATYTIPVIVDAATSDNFKDFGVYKFTVKEQGGAGQGETYDTATEFNVWVYVYQTTDGTKTRYAAIFTGENPDPDNAANKKNDKIENEYSVHDLEVKKTVTGNLGDKTKTFTIVVTLNAQSGKTVQSDITVDTTGGASADKTTILAPWNETQTITITASDSQYLVIKNIPDSVTYTVKETMATRVNDDNPGAHMALINNPDAYYVTGEIDTASSLTEDKTGDKRVLITNKKDITVPTGIILESAPYVLIVALALIGAVVMVSRRKEEY